MKRLLPTTAALCALMVAVGVAPAFADEQDDAVAAIEEWNAWMSEHADGAYHTEEIDTEVDESEADEEVDESTAMLAPCFDGDVELLAALDGGVLPGTVGFAASGDWVFSSEPPEATDAESLSYLFGPSTSATVTTVDDETRETVDDLVELIGSGDFRDCLSDVFQEQIDAMAGEADATGETVPEVEFEIDGDELDVADGGATLTLRFGSEGNTSENVIFLALDGNSLVTVEGTDLGEVDYEIEEAFEALVDAVG